MSDQNRDLRASNDQNAGAGDGRRLIDLAFIRSGDTVELIVSNMPDNVMIRHAYWDYDAQKISAMSNPPMSEEEHASFIAASIERVQGWDSNGGMSALKDRERIQELERQLTESRRK
jgi:hypothetical protein